MSELDPILDGVAAVFLVIGGLMSLAAGVGLLRFPDLHSRMHAATKPQVLGLLMFVLAAALTWRSWELVAIALLTWGVQILTAPVSAHMVGRAGYRSRHVRRDVLVVDELARAVDRIAHEDTARPELDEDRPSS
ncbi:monovalent cation/H(+) antiporter subunit G [Nesterenkonia halophila]|uniref:monovalent cation/H(+) antiporter subunit G n=1 Tax=Nesterenkonia halophila TaxID=302044 RepID=UPI001291C656|nr:monovalent cation/H(+) antiporter subunit G [Nesterenkonia halophila]